MKKIILPSLLVAFAFIGIISRAEALTISPARLELAGDPGTTISGEFLLVNEQENTKTFYSSSENFQAQGETGAPNFTPGKDGLASWVTVAPEVDLQKGEQQKVPFTVTIPKDADAGGHFAAIFLSTAPTSVDSGQVAVGAKIGVLILLRVSGDIKEGGGVTDFNTKDGQIFFSSLPIHFTYKFNNTGNDRVNPVGTIVIKNTLFLKTDEVEANTAQGNVLPGSTRRFDVLWGKEDPKNKTFSQIALYQFKNFAFGMYTTNLKLTYGTSGVTDVSKTIFVFPWQLMILVIPALLIVLFIFFRILKKYNQWIIRKAQSLK